MDMKTLFVALVAALALVASANAAWQPGTLAWATEGTADAKLQDRYDFAFCQGIQRYGTHGFATGRYGVWQKHYVRFECSYDTRFQHCYGAQFESMLTSKRTVWMRLVSPGRCYSL